MKTILLFAAASSLLVAQEKRPAFDVAAIRLSQQDDGQDIDVDAGVFRAHNVTLKRLIALAYTVDMSEILEGPKWLDSDRYDINAKIPADFVGQRPSRVPDMIANLLAERFQLALHREPREIPGFALVVAKKGPKLSPAKPDEKDSDMRSNGRHLIATNVPMEKFAKRLAREAGGPVEDRTGLQGGFDFELDWTPEKLEAVQDLSSDMPSIFVALQEQLGLKLESAKIQGSAVVIDGAVKPAID